MKSRNTFLVFGLGTFGSVVARALFEAGKNVIGLDRDRDRIQVMRPFLTEAVIGNATERSTYDAIGLDSVETAIVSLGNHMEASILAVLHLKESEVPYIIAKAVNDDHKKILSILGAHETIFPEKDTALRLAKTILNPNMMDYLPLADNVSIIEMAPPEPWIGHSIFELDLRRKFHITILAIRDNVTGNLIPNPDPDYMIKESDALIVMGKDKALARIIKT